jgi:glycosyltransferase involved in cell wall biosynthesis
VCRILLVGTVEPRKNLAAVARAAQYLLELDPSIEIVGFGRQGWGTPPEKPLRWRFDATDGDIAAALANSCVFLSGSKEEGFNIPALEAQNAGLPCVLSDIPVHRELFANGSLLMDFRQPEEVAISLHALLHDPASYESLSKAAVCAAAGYTWSNAAEKTLALWNQVR